MMQVLHGSDGQLVVVLAHLGVGLAAFLVGCWLLFARKGTWLHRRVGMAWMILMGLVALTSFWIPAAPPHRFNLLHLLSAIVLVVLAVAYAAVRGGHIKLHRAAMVTAFVVLTGATGAAFLPERGIGKLLFGTHPGEAGGSSAMPGRSKAVS